MLGLQLGASDCVLRHSISRVAAANPLHDVRFRSRDRGVSFLAALEPRGRRLFTVPRRAVIQLAPQKDGIYLSGLFRYFGSHTLEETSPS